MKRRIHTHIHTSIHPYIRIYVCMEAIVAIARLVALLAILVLFRYIVVQLQQASEWILEVCLLAHCCCLCMSFLQPDR